MIGIDILEIARARSLYQTYRNRLKRYLSKEEMSYIRSSRSAVKAFAEVLAIKEAVFKALEVPWFGLLGWRRIALKVQTGHRFSIRLSRDLIGKKLRNHKVWLGVAWTRDFVLARAMIEKSALRGKQFVTLMAESGD